MSIHNPKSTKETYTFTLNRVFGLIEIAKAKFSMTSPMPEKMKNMNNKWAFGDKITIEIDPKDVLILNFKLIK